MAEWPSGRGAEYKLGTWRLVNSDTHVSCGERRMSRYEDLKVYQRAVDLVVEVYRFSGSLPGEEKFGLINQIRRAATSIPLNIAEGSSSSSSKVFNRYLETALGSGYVIK